MALQIITINPENNRIDVPIDSNIVIEFDYPVDPFTVSSGISLYTLSDGLWSGPDLATLDTQYSDVLDVQKENTYYPFTYQITGNTVVLTPGVSLIPDKEHFISIYPGADATRYISRETVGLPIVVGPSGNNVEVTSSYIGKTDTVFEITFNSSNGTDTDLIDVSKGINPVGTFPFVSGEEIDIGELKFKLTGIWDIDNAISLPVFRAVGLATIGENKFTTSKYAVTTPRSHKVEYFDEVGDPLRVVSTIPEDMSQNNKLINPITLKFSKTLKQDQILTDKIKIYRTGLDTGIEKKINHYYKIQGDTLKIYMLGVTRQM